MSNPKSALVNLTITLMCGASVLLATSAALAQQGIDVVLKVDESGSMGDDIADIKNNVLTIFGALPTGSHVGLVGYGTSLSGGTHGGSANIPHVHSALTDDSTAFEEAVAELVASGGTEPGYDAIAGSAGDILNEPLGFRGAPYCNILFTDEPSNGDIATQQDAIDSMNDVGGIFFGVTTAGANASFAQIATDTGGQMFSLEAFRLDPTPLITAVLAACEEAALGGRIDIKPQSCPNPVNTRAKGVLPVAILGSENLDVNDIDPTTVRLEGDVEPLRWAIEDVATPFEGSKEDAFDCTTEGADGFFDLTLKFNTQEVIAVLGRGRR
jgi:hypothetical protein